DGFEVDPSTKSRGRTGVGLIPARRASEEGLAIARPSLASAAGWYGLLFFVLEVGLRSGRRLAMQLDLAGFFQVEYGLKRGFRGLVYFERAFRKTQMVADERAQLIADRTGMAHVETFQVKILITNLDAVDRALGI